MMAGDLIIAPDSISTPFADFDVLSHHHRPRHDHRGPFEELAVFPDREAALGGVAVGNDAFPGVSQFAVKRNIRAIQRHSVGHADMLKGRSGLAGDVGLQFFQRIPDIGAVGKKFLVGKIVRSKNDPMVSIVGSRQVG